ncbi:MAG: DNA mismatch repair protein MutS [Clostridia bacterium]|nr:DNA mismatch repair protein MutS [Clostridia bacterium]
MNTKTNSTLEFDKILDMLADMAMSENIKDKIRELKPYMKETDVLMHMEQTSQGKKIIETAGNPPLAVITNLSKALIQVEQYSVLSPSDLNYVAQFLAACRRMKAYLKKCEYAAPEVSSYSGSIDAIETLHDEIASSIRGEGVDDRASAQLAGIRRKIINTEEQIKDKVNQSLSSNRQYLSENFISFKNGHYTLPVKAQYKNKIKGNIIDMSGSKATYFIEPASVAALNSKMDILKIEEENEIRRILCDLTEKVESQMMTIKINIEAMETLDFIFAKAKLSLKLNGIPAEIVTSRHISIKGGRHPFIDEDDVVPLNFEMNGEARRCVIITGPNTGGKTVVLKTVGLFSLMTQCGLHIPAEQAVFTMHNMVLCDIGDGQSITENLSTFSSHITNIIEIIKRADDQSLVILDELGSGTDPAEGMGIAVAILEELATKKCMLLATTHYPEIKHFAASKQGFVNARMEFDRENMKPLYTLEIGEAGESCALYIAKRLGLPQRMIKRAYEAAYTLEKNEKAKTEYSEDLLNDYPEKQQEKVFLNESIQIKDDKIEKQKELENKFTVGDSVIVYPDKEMGVIYQKANAKGEFGVMIKKEKQLINHKRIKLMVKAEELYPEDYDMSIVFDTVENRKARHKMDKKHDPDLIIKIRE